MRQIQARVRAQSITRRYYTIQMISSGDKGFYNETRTAGFEDEARITVGNRDWHYQILCDFIKCSNSQNEISFCDLGCGTGYFSRAFIENTRFCHACLIDASPEMLSVAQKQFEPYARDLEFLCQRLQDVDWKRFSEKFDYVFSSLAIHHLEDRDKWHLFRNIFNILKDDGWFILYDLIRGDSQEGSSLLEALACYDIQRRILAYLDADALPPDLDLPTLIANDRNIRERDGDKEAPLDPQKSALVEAGFASVTVIFQDVRICGLVCHKIAERRAI